jgi:ubiquinol-cytochrome c reductase iron-sulfur subunit
MANQGKDGVDLVRRRFLVAATSMVGGAVVAVAAIPFVKSMNPSAATRAAGAPVEVDVSKLEPGQLITITWREKPVWVLRRTQEQLAILPTLNPELKDPDSEQPQQLARYRNGYRSIEPEYLVVVAICTHLGCVPTYRPQIAPPDLGLSWEGGFFCQCHGSRYDLAGRVFNGSPARLNLPVPPYYYVSDTVLRIGAIEGGKDKSWRPTAW